MKFTLSLMLISFCFSVHAERFQSKIHTIDTSTKENVPHLIKLENGRVVFVEKEDTDLLNTFRASRKHDDLLEIELAEDNSLVSAESINENKTEEETEPTVRASFEPTVVEGYNNALSLFRRMRRDYQNASQCYNRAHIWQYEENKKTGVSSQKTFLFFTNRYIRNYRYKWWFHVSPMLLVRENGKIYERIIDRRYTSGPRYVKTWTNIFVATHRTCPVAVKYTDYSRNQESQDCYLMKVSQYFWQPRDIVTRDNSGRVKTSWIQSEVDYAYWEAF